MDMGEAKELLLSVRRRHTVGSLVCDADAVTSTSGEHTNRGVLRRNSTYSNSSHWRGLRQYLNHRKPSYTAIPLDSTSEDAEGQDQDGSSAFQNGGGQGKKVLLLKAVRVILPYFNSEEKLWSRGYLCLVLILATGHTFLSVVTSFAERDLTTALATKNQPAFFQAIMKFVGIIVMAVPLQASYYWVREMLILRWRSWLTSYLMTMYFSNDSFYNLKVGIRSDEADTRVEKTMKNGDYFIIKIDNPDQRICEDVASFTSRIVELSLIMFKYTISTVSFLGILWTIAPELVVVLTVYASIGTYTSIRLFGKKLASLAYDTSRKEGNLRYGLVRTQEHTESIAFFGGASRELGIVLQMLTDVIEVLGHRIRWNCKLEVYSSIYSYLTILMPTLVVSPRYFRGEIELGVVTQAAIAFSKIMDAASIVVDNLGSVSSLIAEIVRLYDLLQAMDKERRNASLLSEEEGDERCISVKDDLDGHSELALSIINLNLKTPYFCSEKEKASDFGNESHRITSREENMQMVLISKLFLNLFRGQSLLILGPPGSGKSSLLRAIAGLWRFGSGEIKTLNKSLMMFLPQKPYTILGTLMQQLTYAQNSNDDVFFSVANARDALQKSNLAHLEAMASFDKTIDWGSILSVGESQKLAFARLFVKRPEFAFLDESTSAVSVEEESILYSNLQSICNTYVSVGHRMSLLKFHTHVLQIEKGKWQLHKAGEF